MSIHLRLLLCWFLCLALVAQGQAIGSARGTAHFHTVSTAAALQLDTGHFDSAKRTPHRHGLTSSHQHAPDSADVVSVPAPDEPGAAGHAKQAQPGLDAPLPWVWALPEAAAPQAHARPSSAGFCSHLEPPPVPPPKRRAA